MTSSTPRSYNITLKGRTYRVEILSVGERSAVVEVDGHRHELEIERQTEIADKMETAAGALPHIGQRPPARPTEQPRATGSAKVLVAPMPGDILGVKVGPGESVALGQELFVLEAMKMKSAIRSAREGIVESVEVQEGQSVSYGQPLLTYR